MDFTTIRHLTFDCFGTLIDWETGILRAVRPVLTAHAIAPHDDEILECFATIESSIEAGEFISYRDVLRQTMASLCTHFGFTADAAAVESLPDSLSRWPAFADTADALSRLSLIATISILSNVDADLFEGVLPSLGIRPLHVITADLCRSYKPNPGHFELALARIGSPPGSILHVAQSMYHDIPPALALGMRTVWVDRRHAKPGSGATPPLTTATPHCRVRSLDELARLMGV